MALLAALIASPLACAVDVYVGEEETLDATSVAVDAEKNIIFVAADAGTGANYTWDFGDGRTGEGMQVTHRYSSGGTYIVTVVVSDGTRETVTVKVSGATELQNWALIAIAIMMAVAGLGSGFGLAIAGASAMALTSEKEINLGRVLILAALPFTQVVYAFAIAFFMMSGLGLLGSGGVPPDVAMNPGMAIALIGIGVTVGIGGISAIPQGMNSASSLSAMGKREETFSGGLIVSAMPEAVAMFSFVLGILAILGLGLL